MSEAEKLERKASALRRLSYFIFGVSGLAFLIGVATTMTEPQPNWIAGFVSAGVLVVGLMVNLIAQLIHVRAALQEKK